MFSAKTKQRMPNVNTQPVFLIADTHIRPNNAIATTRQPPRRRAVSPFARPVDDTAPNIIRFTPPRPKYPLTSDVLNGKAVWGNISSESQPKTRVLCTRLCSFASWHALAFASPRLPRGFLRCIVRCNGYQCCSGENSLPTRGIKGQDNRGHPPTVTLFFSEFSSRIPSQRTASQTAFTFSVNAARRHVSAVRLSHIFQRSFR